MEHNQNDHNDLLLDQFMISCYDDDDDDDQTTMEYQAIDDDDQFLADHAANILDDHPNRNCLTNFQAGFSVPNHDHNPSGDHDHHHGSTTAATATRSSSTSEDCATKFVAFRTKTQLETLDDGFKWRKYGKKKVKNTNNPRHYYKCSSGGCNVKKRVERDRDDSGVLITTYQGRHSHPPIHPTFLSN